MPKLQVVQVSHASTDLEIIEAIEAAGEHRYSWRSHDHAKLGDNNQLSWVTPGDINSEGRALFLKRLKQMVAQGILEIRYTWKYRNIAPSCFEPYYKSVRSLPRFRVAKGGKDLVMARGGE